MGSSGRPDAVVACRPVAVTDDRAPSTTPNTRHATDAKGGTIDLVVAGVPVTRLTYYRLTEPDRLELGNIDTAPEHRHNGYATVAVEELRALHPSLPVVSSPTEQNSDDGNGLIARLRERGVPIHYFGCYSGEVGCVCGLE